MNARQAARRRERRRRLGIPAVLAVVLVAAISGLASRPPAATGSRDRQPATDSGPHAGLQTGPAPWGANTTGLA